MSNAPPQGVRTVLSPLRRLSADVAYLLPMGVFLALTGVGVQWPSLFVSSYVVKTILTAVLLFLLRSHYTKIRWNHWHWGILLGVIGVFQWVGTGIALSHFRPQVFGPSEPPFDPRAAFASPVAKWAFIAVRWGGPSLVVPFMEELFWRDFLWRQVAAPADFQLAAIGEWDRGLPLLIVTLAFCTVHPMWLWPAALVWGLMIGLLLIFTRSLGACILMHGVTNFLLGAYVLWFHDWRFW